MVNSQKSIVYSEEEEVSAVVERPLPMHAEDWPGEGPIDLSVHDAPHASSTLEWWYTNCHLELSNGREVAVFAAFFRQLASDPRESDPAYTHSVAWGISLIGEQQLINKVAVDALAPQVGLHNLDSGAKFDDPRIERAFREVLSRGKIPGPTRMFQSEPQVAALGLSLNYDGDRFEKQPNGTYTLTLSDLATGASCELNFSLAKSPMRYGEDGVVHGVSGEVMFYYFVPRARVSGYVKLNGERQSVVKGQGWYDHEFGFAPPPKAQEQGANSTEHGETCWRWLSLQLDDGSELSVYHIMRRATGEVLDHWTMRNDPNGCASVCRGSTLETVDVWRSTRTFIEYPIAMRVRIPSLGTDLEVRATFPDQEVVTIISDPAFWEGTVKVTGKSQGASIGGRGWVECKGFGHANLDQFYSAVGREVRARLDAVLPKAPNTTEAGRMMVRGAGSLGAASNPDLDPQRLADGLVSPIREIADRGGKGWRSYAAMACIDVVGGDSRQFLHWLVMPEIIHVGSLIVDDVQDESAVRRGGPSCHATHGIPRAINAGTAAYFIAEPPVDQDDLPADRKLRIYRLYFDALRAGHAGQALDLDDVAELAEQAARTGDVREIERHVMAVHKLKTAVPAGMFARAGALLGGGTDVQVEALGTFFEAVGLAFQIIDDVLDVRGFERDLKKRGEDIVRGKITLPVVKALATLTPARRWQLWETLKTRDADAQQVADATRLLEESGALDASAEQARDVVERAWTALDPVLEDSQFKLMFRAFSWYVLERHY